jgi:hypothetical protein
MARENQGFQIALIVFVMLTIVLCVTTFLFYKQSDDADRLAKDYAKQKKDKEDELSKKDREFGDFKELVGFPRDDDFATILANSNKERDQYRKLEQDKVDKDDPDKLPSYHKIFEYLQKTKDDKAKAFTNLQYEHIKLKNDYNSVESTMQDRLGKAETQIKDLNKQLSDTIAKAKEQKKQDEQDRKDSSDTWDKAIKEMGGELAKAELKLRESEKKIASLEEENADLKKAKEKRGPEVAQFSGQIKLINHRNNTVWIDLGRSDGLNRQTSFSVYASDATDLKKAGKKADIEVIQIQGEHSAEARIVQDKMTDPIMPGDKIYNPVWTRGQRKHFALIGFMDIHGDGKADMEAVRNLITLNGGVVDYELNDKGEQRGSFTVNTQYLVKGEPPNLTSGIADKKFEDFAREYGKALKAAEKYGIESIPLSELLQRMGWKQPVAVTRAGGRAPDEVQQSKPLDAAPKPSENLEGDAGDAPALNLDDALDDTDSIPKTTPKSASSTKSSDAKSAAKTTAKTTDAKGSAKTDSKTSGTTAAKGADAKAKTAKAAAAAKGAKGKTEDMPGMDMGAP